MLPLPKSLTGAVLPLLMLTLSVPGRAQTVSEQIDSVAQSAFAEGRFHGGLLVADGEDVLYRQAFGLADRARDQPNRPETPFPIFSVTKPFTAILALQLVDRGLLALDGTIAHYLPAFPSAASDRITLHHLLTHSSGLPDYMVEIPGYMQYRPPRLTRDSVFAYVSALPLEFEPGEGFAYSNTGYTVLAAIIEQATGKPFGRLLDERILSPLGMSETRWVPTDGDSVTARQYMPDGQSEAPDSPIFAGEAGIVSTLDDMHRFAVALGSPQLLPEELWNLAFTPHTDPAVVKRFHPGTRFPAGYGFSIAALPMSGGRVARFVMHGGLGYGGSAMLQRSLDDDWVIVLWNNVGGIPPMLPSLIPIAASER